MDGKSLSELETALTEATKVHNRCVSHSADARRAETNALNALNKAQKALDDRIAALRNEATGGDWKDARSASTGRSV